MQELALKNLKTIIRRDVKLPNRIFPSKFDWVYVSEYSTLFKKNSASLFKLLLAMEGSQVAVLSRPDYLNRTAESWKYDLFFISSATEDAEYWNFTRHESTNLTKASISEQPWAVMASEFGATSDLGSWCIYGEYDQEIFLLGFEKPIERGIEHRLANEFFVRPLKQAIQQEYFYGEPNNAIAARQKDILRNSYLIR